MNQILDTVRHVKEKYNRLRGGVEGYSTVSSGLEPAFKANDHHRPAKCKAGDSNSNIEEHHYIIVTPAHSSERNFFVAHDKDQTSARE